MDIADPYQLAMFVMVIGVVVPSMWRSGVAIIVGVWWLAGMAVWPLFTSIPPGFGVAADLTAMALTLWFIRNRADMLIAFLFPAGIAAHVVASPAWDWALSYYFGMVQFGLCGWSALLQSEFDLAKRIEERRHHFDDIFRRLLAVLRRA